MKFRFFDDIVVGITSGVHRRIGLTLIVHFCLFEQGVQSRVENRGENLWKVVFTWRERGSDFCSMISTESFFNYSRRVCEEILRLHGFREGTSVIGVLLM